MAVQVVNTVTLMNNIYILHNNITDMRQIKLQSVGNLLGQQLIIWSHPGCEYVI